MPWGTIATWVSEDRQIQSWPSDGISAQRVSENKVELTTAQGHQGAMQRLTELSAKGAKGRRPGRPTRGEASSECSIM